MDVYAFLHPTLHLLTMEKATGAKRGPNLKKGRVIDADGVGVVLGGQARKIHLSESKA